MRKLPLSLLLLVTAAFIMLSFCLPADAVQAAPATLEAQTNEPTQIQPVQYKIRVQVIDHKSGSRETVTVLIRTNNAQS